MAPNKYITFLFALAIFSIAFKSIAFAQGKHNNTWILGFDFSTSNPGGMFIDFRDDFNVTTFETLAFMQEGTVMSDEEGDLLFYCDGCRVFNAQHEVMENGDMLNYPSPWFESGCKSGLGYNIFQGVISLPFPGDSTRYGIFHLNASTNKNVLDQFLYTEVRIDSDNPLGAVEVKNKILYQGEFSDCLSAVRHGNGRDWWIHVPPREYSDAQQLYLFSTEGVSYPAEHFVDIDTSIVWIGNQGVFSPDGSQYARATGVGEGGVMLMQFDRCTGIFHSPQFIPIEKGEGAISVAGAAFSRNSRYLYVSSSLRLFQNRYQTT